MRRYMFLIAVATLGALLAGCGSVRPDDTASDGSLDRMDWDRDPGTIIVRLDARGTSATPAESLNAIPPCTLWGDGRVVWVTSGGSGQEQVLEARATDDTMRVFLQDIINRGFYTWEDELIPAEAGTGVTQTVSIYLYDELHTVQRSSNWPANGFDTILARCEQLSETPVLVLPWAGWVSAYPIERDDRLPHWYWPEDLDFTPADLVANGEARWLHGEPVEEIWGVLRDTVNRVQVIGPDEQAYELALAVPGISRDAAAPPPGEDHPRPTATPQDTPVPTPIPATEDAAS
ncbi:hypothetical protein [Aggregatilinea lenta]|uniref:hypothetical protein n=1 Tax=Aggregatilinea lenta TaxID=913108 RepID=UPI000E5B5A19|nr:hypothetical protein [Aggregatilinea lenta]